MIQISALPAFEDNYIWALCQPDTSYCLVVDPGDATPVLNFLATTGKQLHSILITHHHHDHTGGIETLRQHFPDIQIIGPAAEQHRIKGLTTLVQDGDIVELTQLDLKFEVMAVPGHTLGHIAFYSAQVLFCGDTLFSAGCGRLFEGSPAQMWQSLQRLRQLPDDTRIYCTHEYTCSNLKFALSVEPDNQLAVDYARHCNLLRQQNKPTLPTTVGLEKQINPFLRCDNNQLQTKWQQNDALALFTQLREAKDRFNA